MITTLRAALIALAAAASVPAAAQTLSTSVMRPTAVAPEVGLIAGAMPGSSGAATYYLSLGLERGDLVAQLSASGRANTPKRLTVELLGNDLRPVASSYVLAELDAKGETVKSFPVDAAGRHVLRLIVDGPETARFCVMFGGAAFPRSKPASCPEPAGAPVRVEAPSPAPAPAPAPLPRTIEVVERRCEQRLRIGSELLFDFDRAELRPAASATLEAIVGHVKAANRPLTVEGHTDAVGTDSYNQRLSEQRARAVEEELRQRVLGAGINVRGYGKSRPIALNQHADGSDNPDGRQKNRRVEVVIDTCG